MNPVTQHPNATVGGLSASAGGVLVVWVASLLGYEMPAEVIPVVSGVCAAFVLALGRNGVRGIACRLWRGDES